MENERVIPVSGTVMSTYCPAQNLKGSSVTISGRGTYRIDVRAEGFGAGQSQPTSVSVGQTATVNFTLLSRGHLTVG